MSPLHTIKRNHLRTKHELIFLNKLIKKIMTTNVNKCLKNRITLVKINLQARYGPRFAHPEVYVALSK